MKKFIKIIAAFLVTAFFSACKTDDTAAKMDASNLTSYIDSVDKLKPVYSETEWQMIENGYQDHNTKVEKEISNLDEAAKAKVEADRKRYEAFKTNYENRIKEMHDADAMAMKKRMEIRNELFGDPNPGPNNNWGFVTAANVVSVYKRFIDKAREKGDNYSDADWVETKLLWKSLNERKEAINKDISTIDKITIDHLRVAYLAIKAVNRPISQMNEDVKENK